MASILESRALLDFWRMAKSAGLFSTRSSLACANENSSQKEIQNENQVGGVMCVRVKVLTCTHACGRWQRRWQKMQSGSDYHINSK
jgi:hypothetical protein